MTDQRIPSRRLSRTSDTKSRCSQARSKRLPQLLRINQLAQTFNVDRLPVQRTFCAPHDFQPGFSHQSRLDCYMNYYMTFAVTSSLEDVQRSTIRFR
jgi:hypothetical protein